MPEKKPDPLPPPRNRHERRKRATEQRHARPWLPRIVTTAMTSEWFAHEPSDKPATGGFTRRAPSSDPGPATFD